jgi:hypothetical protein
MHDTAARKRKQVPGGYLIIGIDPHKKRPAAVAITRDFTIQTKFKIDNTNEALARKRKPVASNGKIKIKDKNTGKVYSSKNNAYQSLLKSVELKPGRQGTVRTRTSQEHLRLV